MSPMATATAPSKTSVRASMADPKAEAAVQMLGVHKWYGEFHVLRDINLHVRRGERIVICGPSGSGKSTMIRCINRLEEHQKGRIIVDGTELTNDLKTHRRDPPRGRHGVPALQPVPAPHHPRELHARPDLGEEDAEEARPKRSR